MDGSKNLSPTKQSDDALVAVKPVTGIALQGMVHESLVTAKAALAAEVGAESNVADMLFRKGKRHLSEWKTTYVWAETRLAFASFLKAAELGHAEAQFLVGDCYLSSQLIPGDHRQAVKWFRKSADQKYPPAMERLGYCCANGIGIATDTCAAAWYQPASARECAAARLAADTHAAAAWYQKGAEAGEVRAQSEFGLYCHRGWGGVPQNSDEAFKWFWRAAEEGRAYFDMEGINHLLDGRRTARLLLGYCYYYGHGTSKDFTEAVKWFKLAHGSEYEAYDWVNVPLADCYLRGLGVSRDFPEAVELLSEFREGFLSMGLCYRDGIFPFSDDFLGEMTVPKNWANAYALLKIAEDKKASWPPELGEYIEDHESVLARAALVGFIPQMSAADIQRGEALLAELKQEVARRDASRS